MGLFGAITLRTRNLSVHLNVVQIKCLRHDGKRNPTLVAPAKEVRDESALSVITVCASQGNEFALDERPCPNQLVLG
jgi:hypothetical protein